MTKMIRHASHGDLASLRTVAESTGMFIGDELDSFVEEMERHFQAVESGNDPNSTLAVALGDAQQIIGAIYFMPEAMAQGVINLLFIGVVPGMRQRAIGRQMLEFFEASAKSANARLAIIETASAPMFQPARALYRSAGYNEDGRIRDFYDDGLDKVIFRKRL